MASSRTGMHAARLGLFALLAVSACAQSRIPPEQSKRLNIIFSEAVANHTLACDAEAARPFLDFAFRFEIGYVVHCPLKEFGGVETSIATHMRVWAGDAAPVWFSQWYRVPGIPKDASSTFNLQRDHNDVEFSGVIAAGEGDYSVDLVVVDRRHRLFYKSWKTKVCAHGAETRTPISMQPNTVAALKFADWPRIRSERNLAHLTLLVDAAPIQSSSMRLRAWDRAFLIEALSSVMTLLPSNSVRVAAFNLDQHREVFRSSDFNAQETQRLSDALDELELGKISYRTLQQAESQGASGMLLSLLEREIGARDAPDAILLLGPANRLADKIPPYFVADRHTAGPPVFYLKYSPISPPHVHIPFAPAMGIRQDLSGMLNLQGDNNGEFPDIIQHAASVFGGVTINVHSPADLADALKKIDRRLHPAPPMPEMQR